MSRPTPTEDLISPRHAQGPRLDHPASSGLHGFRITSFLLGAHPVEALQEVVRGELDLLVPPLGRPVDARDQAGAVHPAEVAVDEGVPRLGLVVGALGEPEVPGGVLLPGVPLEVGVLRRRRAAAPRPSRCRGRTAGRRSAPRRVVPLLDSLRTWPRWQPPRPSGRCRGVHRSAPDQRMDRGVRSCYNRTYVRTDWIEELDAQMAADALVAVHQEVRAAEAKQFVLAAHWADLHAGHDFADEVTGTPARHAAGGADPRRPQRVCGRVPGDRGVRRGRAGGADRSVDGGRGAADRRRGGGAAPAPAAVERHPGGARPGVGGRQGGPPVHPGAARRPRRPSGSTPRRTPYVTTLPPKRFLDLVEAKIIAGRPRGGRGTGAGQGVGAVRARGQTDEDGLRTLVARAHAGDITYVVAVLDRIAVILAERATTGRWRCSAPRRCGCWATRPGRWRCSPRPTLERGRPERETPGELGQEALFPYGDTGWIRDTAGRAAARRLPGPGRPPAPRRAKGSPGCRSSRHSRPSPVAGRRRTAGRARYRAGTADRALLTSLLEALGRFDAVAAGPGDGPARAPVGGGARPPARGVIRVEELGPVVLAEVRDWLTHPFSPDQIRQQVRVRPVLDAATVVPVDRYEWPDADERAGHLPHPVRGVPVRHPAVPGRPTTTIRGPTSRTAHRGRPAWRTTPSSAGSTTG